MGTTSVKAAGIRWAAAGAAVLLLTGCGGGGGDDKATALDKAQVTSVLPDEGALPDWKFSEDPSAAPMSEAARKNFCPSTEGEGCEDSSFFGSVSFQRDDENARARFWMVAYKDEKAAEAAYDVLWKNTARTAGRDEADLGSVGARSDAVAGPVGYDGAYGVTGQIRVGTALLWVASDARSEKALDKDLVKDLAALFSDRAQQAQNGDDPSAKL
ncbi:MULTISPECIES: hypothetical protein [unclassified Streptomyces]|uniref:hypothetical protein n=1 Tax=unclassified Streptomyces TaxID=2593676 RepID=UPI00093DC196|nr:hypothetical protein [Streptomyces sp. CB02058]OKI91551.1 hypothetical protein AMK10_26405 [Streptomyces sp. CB02058]